MRWFCEAYSVLEEKFRIVLRIHYLHCRENIINFWSEITKISPSQFQKVYIKTTSLKYRTCGIVVHNKNLFKRIKVWKLGFLEKLNILNQYAPVA